MSKPSTPVEEVMGRIKEAMRAKIIETQDITRDVKTDSDMLTGINMDAQEINGKLCQLDLEIGNNNLNWDVTTENSITSRKKYGKLIVYGKELIRKILRWHINPFVDQQREFNGSVTRSINLLGNLVHAFVDNNRQLKNKISQLESKVESIDERTSKLLVNARVEKNELQLVELKETMENSIEESERKIAGLKEALDSNQKDIEVSLEENRSQLLKQLQAELTISADRLRRIERRINEGIGIDINTPVIHKLINQDKQQHPDMDYFLFEQRYRGSREEIKERQKVYVDYFKGKSNVLDMGCGRGEFVELLIETGIGVSGIDLNEDMVNYCQDRGLPVVKGDLFDYLNSIEDHSLDGIFSAQVIEHLTPESLPHLVALSYAKLKPTGVVVLETINPQNLLAVANWFYMDLSHIRPVHPQTIQFIMETEGFHKTEFIYSSPCTDSMIPDLYIEGVNENLQEFNQAMSRINQLLYGPQDYAIVGVK